MAHNFKIIAFFTFHFVTVDASNNTPALSPTHTPIQMIKCTSKINDAST